MSKKQLTVVLTVNADTCVTALQKWLETCPHAHSVEVVSSAVSDDSGCAAAIEGDKGAGGVEFVAPFSVGDEVQLESGGPVLKVDAFKFDEHEGKVKVRCTWTDPETGEPCEGWFEDASILKAAPTTDADNPPDAGETQQTDTEQAAA